MKVAAVSEDFLTLSGKAGKARRFLVYEAERNRTPLLERKYELPAHVPAFHDLHSPRYRECTVCHVAVHGSNTSPGLLK